MAKIFENLWQVKWWLHLFMLGALYTFLLLTYPAQLPGETAATTVYIVTYDFTVFSGCAYFAAYFLLPRFFLRGRYMLFFLCSLLLIVTGTMLILANDLLLLRSEKNEVENFGMEALSFFSTAGMLLLIILVGVGIRSLINWLQSMQQLQTIRKEKLKTELAFLRSQMNPHFLFNTINLIFGHIDKSNTTARNMMLKFSELLRYQLYECDVAFIAIEKEVNYLHNYIALQKLRKSGNLECAFTLSGILSGFEITPLLLIPFIENAFKYVSSDDVRPNYLRIQLSRTEQELAFSCVNTKDHFMNKEFIRRGGLGIQNVRRRLQLVYPERHSLHINNTYDTFEVHLTIAL